EAASASPRTQIAPRRGVEGPRGRIASPAPHSHAWEPSLGSGARPASWVLGYARRAGFWGTPGELGRGAHPARIRPRRRLCGEVLQPGRRDRRARDVNEHGRARGPRRPAQLHADLTGKEVALAPVA